MQATLLNSTGMSKFWQLMESRFSKILYLNHLIWPNLAKTLTFYTNCIRLNPNMYLNLKITILIHLRDF